MFTIRKKQRDELFTSIRRSRQNLQRLIPRIIIRLNTLGFLSWPEINIQKASEAGNMQTLLRQNDICLIVVRDVILAGKYGLYKEDSLVQFAGYRFLLGPGWLNLRGIRGALERRSSTEHEKATELALAIEMALD